MNAKRKPLPFVFKLIAILALAFALSSCETQGQRRAALAGGITGAIIGGAATDSVVGAAIGGAIGAGVGARINRRRAYYGKRRIFY